MNEEKITHNQKVKKVFQEVASRYDLMNTLLSFGLDGYWRKKAAILAKPKGKKILDVCAGTGDLSIEMLRKGDDQTQIIALDFAKEMLAIGQQKAKKVDQKRQITFSIGDATRMNLPDEIVDVVTIAFGIRNIENEKKLTTIQEFLRVTKKGGKLICLEFSNSPNVFINRVYFFYLARIAPLIAKIFSKKPEAYIYLGETIKSFPNKEKIAAIIKKAGWKKVEYKDLSLGIVTLHQAEKGK